MVKFYISDRWEDTTGHFFAYGTNYPYYNYPTIQLNQPATDYKRSYEEARTYPQHVYGFIVADKVTLTGDTITIEGYFGAYHGYDNTRANFCFVILPSNYVDVDQVPPAYLKIEWKLSNFGWSNGSYGHYAYVKLRINPDNTVTILESNPGDPGISASNPYDLIRQEVTVLFGYRDSWTADWNQWACARKDSYIDLPVSVQYTEELSDSSVVSDAISTKTAFYRSFTDISNVGDYKKLYTEKINLDKIITKEKQTLTPSKVSVEIIIPHEKISLRPLLSIRDLVFPEYILSIIRGKIVKDLSKVLDRLTRKAVFYRGFTDSSRVFDYKKLLTYKKLKEIASSADRLTKLISKIYVDASKAIDRFIKEPSKKLVDANYSYDRLVLGTAKSFVELAIPCDYISLESVKVYRDVSNVYEKVSKTASKEFTDYSKTIDLKLVRGVRKLFKEPVATVDVLSKEMVKVYRDAGKTYDKFSMLMAKELIDVSKVIDMFTRIVEYYRVFTDLGYVADYSMLSTVKPILELVTTYEKTAVGTTKTGMDASKALDYLKLSSEKRLVELILIYDYISKLINKYYSDAVLTYDKLNIVPSIYLKEVIYPDYLLSKETTKHYAEKSYVSDIIYKTFGKTFKDVSYITDFHKLLITKVFRELSYSIDIIYKEIIKTYLDVSTVSDYVKLPTLKTLLETSYVKEMFSKTAVFHRSFMDSSIVSDYKAFNFSKPLKDVLLSFDYISKQVLVSKFDISYVGDYLSKLLVTYLRDTIINLDYLASETYRTLRDLATVTDYLYTKSAKFLMDVVYPEFTISKDTVKKYRETAFTIDYLYKVFGRQVSDYVTTLDFLKLVASKAFREAITSYDYLVKDIGKVSKDVGTASDMIKLLSLKTLLETTFIKEMFSKIVSYHREFTDASLVYEVVSKDIGKQFMELSTIYDYLRLVFTKKVLDSAVTYDRIAKLITSVIADESIVADFLYIARLVTLKDLVYPEFYIRRELSKQFLDASLISDYVYTYLGKILRDSSLVSDYLRIASVKELLDTSLVSDFIEYSKYFYRVLRDAVFPDFVVGKTMIKRFFDASTITDVATRVLSKYLLDEAFVSDVLEKFVTHLVSVLDRVYPEYVISRHGIFHKYDIAKIVEVFVTWALWLYGYELRRMRVGDIIRPEDFNNPLYVAMKESDECKQLWSAVNPGKPYPDSINKLDDTLASLSPVSRGDYVLAEHINTLLDACLYIYETLRDIYNDYIDKLGGSRDPEIEHYLDLMKSILTSPKFAYAGEWIYPDYFLQVYELLIYGHYVITLLKPKLGIK